MPLIHLAALGWDESPSQGLVLCSWGVFFLIFALAGMGECGKFSQQMRLIRNKALGVGMLWMSCVVFTCHAAAVLNIYSHRHYGVDEEVNRLFQDRTGIEVRVVNADADQLIERLRAEGGNSPADVLITVDKTRMERARALGLLEKLEVASLDLPLAPEGLNDPEGYWHAYMIRARIIAVAKGRVGPGEIRRYEDLADPKWRGRLLIRSSANPYNQGLMASLIAANGEAEATRWAQGVARNLARPPQGGDRDQIKAVADGLADVCVVNSYYLATMLESPDRSEREAARKLDVIFPNQADRGTHANVSAIALLKNAKNIDAVRQYLKFLLSPEIQSMLANGAYEHPASLNHTLTDVHRSWGEFKVDRETFRELATHHESATRVFNTARWR